MKSPSVPRLCLMLLLAFLFSCKKDQESVTPDLYFKTIQDGTVLWNSVEIELGISHPESLTKVEILVNSKLVSTEARAPFKAQWNTLTITDGTYELKAISTDQQGNTKEAKVNVVVQNALISLQVPQDHLNLPNGQLDRGWIFASSTQGEVLALAEIKNGEKITLSNAGFNGKSFVLSEAYLTDYGTSLEISSFLEVNRGRWTLAVETQGAATVGNLSVQFKDSLGTHPYYVSTSGDSRVFQEGGNSIKLKLTQSPSRLFIRQIGQDINHYNLIEGLTPNENYSGLFTDLNKPLESMLAIVPVGTQTMGIRLYGFPKTAQFDEFYPLGVFSLNVDKVKIEFPGNAFPVYGSESVYRGNNIRLHSFHPTKLYDITPLSAQVIFKDASNVSATVATFGKFDIYVVGWAYASQTIGFSWVLTGGSGQSDFLKLPELPSKIRNAGVSPFDRGRLGFLNVIQIADYEIANDYRSYLLYIAEHGYNAPYLFGKAWKEQTFSSNGITGGGRMNMEEIPSIKQRLSRRD